MKIFTIVGARPQFIKAGMISRLLESEDGKRKCWLPLGNSKILHVSSFFYELRIRNPEYQLVYGLGVTGPKLAQRWWLLIIAKAMSGVHKAKRQQWKPW